MPSNNIIVGNLVESLKTKDSTLYNILRKLTDNVDEVYKAIFTGPLPHVSAENLDFSHVDLTEFPQTQLPVTVAFTNYANVFIQDQTIQKDDPLFELVADTGFGSYLARTTGDAGNTRLQRLGDSQSLLGAGMFWDGAALTSEGGDTVGLTLNFDSVAFNFQQFIAGVLTSCLQVLPDGQVTIGELDTQVDMDSNDLGLRNTTFIRGTNFAGTHNMPMMGIDINDLISIGSNPTGATTGEGNISIPSAVNADLPTAGATRNGIVIIDKTNHKLCYYINGLRYALLGVAF